MKYIHIIHVAETPTNLTNVIVSQGLKIKRKRKRLVNNAFNDLVGPCIISKDF